MGIAGPFIVFIIASLLTPVFNYWVVSKPEVVYEEQISGLMLDTKSPFYAVNLNKHPYFLTGVVKDARERAEKKPALKVALLEDDKFDEVREELTPPGI